MARIGPNMRGVSQRPEIFVFRSMLCGRHLPLMRLELMSIGPFLIGGMGRGTLIMLWRVRVLIAIICVIAFNQVKRMIGIMPRMPIG